MKRAEKLKLLWCYYTDAVARYRAAIKKDAALEKENYMEADVQKGMEDYNQGRMEGLEAWVWDTYLDEDNLGYQTMRDTMARLREIAQKDATGGVRANYKAIEHIGKEMDVDDD